MNKKKRKMLFAIISIFILLVIIILILITKLKEDNSDTYIDENGNVIKIEPEGDNEADVMSYENEKLKNTTYFFNIESYINNYLNAIKLENTLEIMNVLSEDFISENNLTRGNVIENIEKSYEFLALEIYETRDDSLYSYIVGGTINDGMYNINKYYVFNLDLENYTYSITPLYNKNYNNIEKIKIKNKLTNIKENSHNKFEFKKFNNESIVKKYITYYTGLQKNNPEKAYEMLDNEYKEIRFQNNYNNFLYYINQMNSNSKLDTNLKSLSEGSYNGKEAYIIKTEKDNRYTIIEDSPMEFTMILDDYSIVTESFKNKYKKSTDTKKIATNVDKVMKMINTYDYVGLYNLLDYDYKNNNFANIDILINYINDNFYNSNIYEIKNIKTQNNSYISEIKVYKNNEQDSEYSNKKIIIKLGEDTNFTILFE